MEGGLHTQIHLTAHAPPPNYSVWPLPPSPFPPTCHRAEVGGRRVCCWHGPRSILGVRHTLEHRPGVCGVEVQANTQGFTTGFRVLLQVLVRALLQVLVRVLLQVLVRVLHFGAQSRCLGLRVSRQQAAAQPRCLQADISMRVGP